LQQIFNFFRGLICVPLLCSYPDLKPLTPGGVSMGPSDICS
jgi:hypothetical protein